MSDFFKKLLGNILSASGSLNHDAQIFLKGSSGGEKIQFPIPPGEFKATVRQNNQTININNIGDVNMIGNDGLKDNTNVLFVTAASGAAITASYTWAADTVYLESIACIFNR